MRSGEAWEAKVVEYARLSGWLVAHFRAAKTEKGWRTPVSADGAGFLDLVMVRGPRLLFVECKAGTGRMTDAQRVWMKALQAVPGIEVYLWRDDDWPVVERLLRRDA